MENQNKKIIYDIIINGNQITKIALIKAGITESQIQELIEDNFIVQKDNNQYELYTLYDLYYYGLEQLLLKDLKTANTCFKRCHQLDPNNRFFVLQLFLKSLKIHDYETAKKRFAQIDAIEPDKYNYRNNLYLYLLNMITPCHYTYKERLSNIDYDSVFPNPTSDEYQNKKMNDIRHLIMKFKYRHALYKINKLIKEDSCSNLENEVLKELISQIIQVEKEFKLLLLDFATDKKYEEIRTLLQEQSKRRQLSNSDTYIKILCQKIITLNHDGIPQKSSVTDTTCLYEAINGNNFTLAENINKGIMKSCNSPLDNQIIAILLSDLNKQISKLEEENNQSGAKDISHKEYINEIEELAYYLQEEKISIESAAKNMGIMQEQVLLIKLIYARDFYYQEMYLQGDMLLKEVEKSKEKTTRVIKFLNEIRTNKKFYKNRTNEHTKKRTLYMI